MNQSKGQWPSLILRIIKQHTVNGLHNCSVNQHSTLIQHVKVHKPIEPKPLNTGTCSAVQLRIESTNIFFGGPIIYICFFLKQAACLSLSSASGGLKRILFQNIAEITKSTMLKFVLYVFLRISNTVFLCLHLLKN